MHHPVGGGSAPAPCAPIFLASPDVVSCDDADAQLSSPPTTSMAASISAKLQADA